MTMCDNIESIIMITISREKCLQRQQLRQRPQQQQPHENKEAKTMPQTRQKIEEEENQCKPLKKHMLEATDN